MTQRARLIVLLICALSGASLLFMGLSAKRWAPVGDEVQYLGYGYTLHHRGTFARTFPDGSHELSFPREPGYPFFIAAMMAFDGQLRSVDPKCLVESGNWNCDLGRYRSLQWANVGFVALTALFVALAALRLGAGAVPAAAAAGACALNFQAMSIRHTLMSDYMAMALVALSTWLVIDALRTRKLSTSIGCGLALAALTLTKAIYLYFLIAAAVFVLLGVAWRRYGNGRKSTLAALVFLTAAIGPVLGWMTYSKSHGGPFAITDPMRIGLVLSGRERFNDMTIREWTTSFVWWMRGMGDNLARRYLPEASYVRLNDGNSDGFFQDGERRFFTMRDALAKERNLSSARASREVEKLMFERIAARPIKHIVTSVPLAYRGIWIDEFIVISLPALFAVLIVGTRRRNILVLACFLPSVYSLLAYPLLSINIPRYQLTALPGFALALGLCLAWWLERRRARGVPV